MIKSRKPNYFISHLITSLPIIISNMLNNNTKYILRISGLPKMTLLKATISATFEWRVGRGGHVIPGIAGWDENVGF